MKFKSKFTELATGDTIPNTAVVIFLTDVEHSNCHFRKIPGISLEKLVYKFSYRLSVGGPKIIKICTGHCVRTD